MAYDAAEHVATAYRNACPRKDVTYQPVGSGAAADFASGATTIAITDRPLTDSELADAEDRCDVRQVPLAAFPVALGFHVSGVRRITLDQATLAGILDGRITRWNDQEIVALNTDAVLPDATITPVYRETDAVTTSVLQQYVDERTFTGVAVTSDEEVRSKVASTEGAIGYVSAGADADSDGSFVVLNDALPSVSSVAAAVANALGTDGLEVTQEDLFLPEPVDGVQPYPLVWTVQATMCADDPSARDFLLASLSAQAGATDFVLPTGVWADRLRAALQ